MKNSFPVRLHPFVATTALGMRDISIDLRVAFGRPIVSKAGVSTRAIAQRIEAGEDPGAVAEDYGLSASEIEQAVVYEHAA